MKTDLTQADRDRLLREIHAATVKGAPANQKLVAAAREVVAARYDTGDAGWYRLKEAIGALEDIVGRPEESQR